MEHETVLDLLKNGWMDLIWNIKPSIPQYITQAGMTIFVSMGMTFFVWAKSPIRSPFTQAVVFLFCLVFCLNYPFQNVRAHVTEGNYTLFVTVCIGFMIFLPKPLSFLLAPTIKGQMIVFRIITGVMWFLFFVQLFV